MGEVFKEKLTLLTRLFHLKMKNAALAKIAGACFCGG